jgi:hypothetical protein
MITPNPDEKQTLNGLCFTNLQINEQAEHKTKIIKRNPHGTSLAGFDEFSVEIS